MQLLLQCVPRCQVLVEVCNTGLVLVLVLVDFVRCLGLRVQALRLFTLLLAESLELIGPVEHSTHHDLACHCKASRVHLSENDRAFLPWQHLYVVAGALERLLELELVKLGVVDILTVLGLTLIVDDMHVPIAFLGHGKVLSDAWGALLGEVGHFGLRGKLKLSTAAHELTHKVILVEETLLVTKEDGLGLTVATHTELGVLHVVRPVELNEHVVLTRFQILILLPNVTIHALFTVLVDEPLLLSIGVFDLRDDESHIAVVVVDVAIEAPVIRLVDRQVVMAARGADLEAN